MVLTPAERRAVLLVLGLLVLGTLRDLVGVRRPAQPAPGRGAVRASESRPEERGDGNSIGLDSSASRPEGPLDLNRASVTELDGLPGVGPVLARRIAEHRLRYGRFHDPRDLCAVKGIGPRLYARLRPLVEVRTP